MSEEYWTDSAWNRVIMISSRFLGGSFLQNDISTYRIETFLLKQHREKKDTKKIFKVGSICLTDYFRADDEHDAVLMYKNKYYDTDTIKGENNQYIITTRFGRDLTIDVEQLMYPTKPESKKVKNVSRISTSFIWNKIPIVLIFLGVFGCCLMCGIGLPYAFNWATIVFLWSIAISILIDMGKEETK